MTPAFDTWPAWLAVAQERGGSADFSELQLLARQPVLLRVAAALLLAGLLGDILLITRALAWCRREAAERVCRGRVGPKPWGLRVLLLVTLLVVGAVVGWSALCSAVASLARLEEAALWPFITGELLSRITLLIAAAVYLQRRWPGWPSWFGLPPPGWMATLARGGFAWLAVLPPLTATMAVVDWASQHWGIPVTRQPVVDLLLNTDSRATIALIGGFAVVVAPIFEELFFRGFAYPALKQRFGAVPALVTVALLFGLAHGHLPSLAPLFVLGLALGLAYEASGSLVAPILLHALFNAANIGMLLALRCAP